MQLYLSMTLIRQQPLIKRNRKLKSMRYLHANHDEIMEAMLGRVLKAIANDVNKDIILEDYPSKCQS